MGTYLVAYDLNRPGQGYGQLIAELKSFANWWHYLDSAWLIKTNLSVVGIRDKLSPYIDANDELLVAKLSGEAAWTGFDSAASQWIKDNL